MTTKPNTDLLLANLAKLQAEGNELLRKILDALQNPQHVVDAETKRIRGEAEQAWPG
jgi:hypothetical protein